MNSFPEVTKRCCCGCSRIVFTKFDQNEYEFSFENNITDNWFSLGERIKLAIKILLNKKNYYAQIEIDSGEDVLNFLEECKRLV